MIKFNLLFVLLLTCFAGISRAQGIVVSGKVTEKGSNEPIPGVTVMVKGGTQGAQTAVDGTYRLTITGKGPLILIFRSISYKSVEQAITGSQTLNIQLEMATNTLNEVVAIGYASIKRKELTGSSASVSGDDLKLAPVTTAAQALTGKAAGVSVITQSGAPGADINIVIRGGTTITQGSSPLYIVDGFQMDNALREVDINDIASIDVLKDASSTAIYGSRGSNGVVLITTKSAKAGKTEVSYNGYYGTEKLGKKLQLLNVLDYVKYQYEFQNLAGKDANWAAYFGGDINAPDYYTGAYSRINADYASREGIDWQDVVFGGRATSQNHNININSGNDRTRFMLSYNNTGENGILAKHSYLKNGIRLKLNHEIWKGLRADFNTNFQDTRTEGGGSLGGALKMTILQPVTGGKMYTNQQLIGTDISDSMLAYDSQYDVYNPIITNDAVTNTSLNRQFSGNGGLELDITKDIKLRTSGSYLWRQIRADYWDDGRTKTAQNNGGPYGSRNNSEKYTWQITNTLNWSHNFGKHNVGFLLGQEVNYSQSENLNNSYYQFPVSNFGLNDVSQATNIKNTYSSGLSRYSLSSFFGRGSYNYQGRYIANFTLRADGSSKFAPGNQWGYFPSVSAAWRISEEKFMQAQNVINNLKLRVGYGTSGNNDIDDYVYVTSYGSGSYAVNNANFQTLVPGSVVGNPRVKWEKTVSTDIGLDIDIFKSRISFSADYYNNESNNLLIQNQIPSSSGYTTQFQNIGAIRNRGVEFVLSSNNIATKQFRWKTSFNISFNRSKVLAIYGQSDNDYFISNYGSRIDYMIKVGAPLGQFYGYKYAGVYTTDDFNQNADGTYTLKNGVPRAKAAAPANVKPGDVKYVTTAGDKDANGNPTWSANDRTVIGNAQPKYQGGITNTFNYKGLDLTVFMNFSVGNQIFNMNSQRFIGPYLPNQNTLAVMNTRFTLIDPLTGKQTTNLSRLAALNPQQHDPNAMWSLHADNKIAITDALDYYLEDGSFLRLSTITLGYALPKNLISKVKMSNLRVYCTLNNIYTFTKYKGYDPEVSATSSILNMGVDNSAYPRSKSVVFGLNVTF
ncbi:SusC/RagA family TonB-linked outer membrane protein [Mucilaginibacter paludis]|uniref:TonB-dependent receptor n=1 Tax=Mucilaginibacter paludis DSM 18603 TaxID=714943 RepID=H1Y781_9SPHI|nr:TonB-dependent receptor [Mucilaginibacter paludis]EHQ28968.1 TonB-dependent receptor [Mucilaginibacter paludis DSM 18603]